MKDIMLFTSEFPFGSKETYLLNEIEACECINNIYIVPLFTTMNKKREINNDKVNIKTIEFEGIKLNKLFKQYLTFFCDKDIWREINYILKSKKNVIKKIKKMIWFWSRTIKLYVQIEDYIDKSQIDLTQLVIYSYWMAEHAYIASKLSSRFKEIKIISRCHGYDLYEYRSELDYIPFRNQIFNNTDYILPICKNGYDYIVSRYRDIDRNKLKISFLGTKDYGYNLRIQDDKFKIISCSNIVDVKRIDLIVKSLMYITDFEVEWTHYGDGKNKEEILELCKRLPDNIRYIFKGQVDNEEILKQYEIQNFDLFINVSLAEGLPVSIMEAQSKGIVVIATDVGGTSEIITDKFNGFLLDKNFKEEELAEILIKYKELPDEEKIIMKKRSRQIWSKNFDASINYRCFFKWIDEI